MAWTPASPKRWLLAAGLLAIAGGCAAPKPALTPVLSERGRESFSADADAINNRAGRPPTPSLSTEVQPASFLAPDEGQEPEPIAAPVVSNAIDFGTALGLAAGQNPQVTLARARIDEAYARLAASRATWLPSIRAGVNYNKHEGRIQDVAGQIIETSRGSLYSGLGASAVGAGSPAVPGVYANFRLSDAVFQPRIETQSLAARQHAADTAAQEVMLATALAYIELLDAAQARAIAAETLHHAQGLADLTEKFSQAGEGTQADADRARSELAVRQNNVARADEALQVASARLAELLSEDPTVALVPSEKAMTPIELVSHETPVRDLVSQGLASRPELAESRHLVEEAVQRLRRERFAPLLPSVLLGVSYGANGGGLGSDLSRFGDRFDLDAAAWWELRQLGLGERAARESAQSRIEQARLTQVRAMDRVAREVVEAHSQVVHRHKQIATAEKGISAARDSYRKNVERIREGQGLPLEALQSIQALDQAQRDYLRAVAGYNQAQFSLNRAIGWSQ